MSSDAWSAHLGLAGVGVGGQRQQMAEVPGVGVGRNIPGGGDDGDGDGDVGASGGEALAQREDAQHSESGDPAEGASSVWGLDQGGGPTEQPWGGRAAAESAAWGAEATKWSEQG